MWAETFILTVVGAMTVILSHTARFESLVTTACTSDKSVGVGTPLPVEEVITILISFLYCPVQFICTLAPATPCTDRAVCLYHSVVTFQVLLERILLIRTLYASSDSSSVPPVASVVLFVTKSIQVGFVTKFVIFPIATFPLVPVFTAVIVADTVRYPVPFTVAGEVQGNSPLSGIAYPVPVVDQTFVNAPPLLK